MSLFPKHKTYVEAFLGGGAVFFEKEPSEVEVINDLDGKLVMDYRRVVHAPSFSEAYPILTTKRAQDRFLRQTHRDIPSQIVESLLRRCNGFGGNYITKGGVFKTSAHERKLHDIGLYKERLASAHLLNTTYAEVFAKVDAPSTFFFLDPPYEMSKGIGYAAGSESFDFVAFADALRGLKGKFLVTINDSPYIRKVFKGFKQYRYVVVGHHSEESSIGAKDRPELLITNYTLPVGWKSRMTKGVLSGGAYAVDEPSLYLEEVKRRAKKHGYDPESVSFAEDGKHKIQYETPTGQIVRFGRVGYGDFILWSWLEEEGKVPKGFAEEKRNTFHASHEAIKGKWRSNKYSPNMLALKLLW